MLDLKAIGWKRQAGLGALIGLAVSVPLVLIYVNRGPRTPDEAAALLADNPLAARALPVFKQTFPADYDRVMLDAIQYSRANPPDQQAATAAFATMQSLVASHASDNARAPDAYLVALARRGEQY